MKHIFAIEFGQWRDERCFARRDRFDEDPMGGFGHRFRGRHHGGFGHRRERMFDAGDVKLVLLKLLSEQPSYGYQLIKTMEDRLAGGYAPSPGVIYPTLTLLEEEGLASASTDSAKKVYSVTPDGAEYLERHRRRVDELFERIIEAGKTFERERSPEILRAFLNLRESVMAKVSRRRDSPDQVRKITELIDAAARAIDEL
jgi:DNA-binding PadR family transcriptional regulator